jgi:hypothetical protein
MMSIFHRLTAAKPSKFLIGFITILSLLEEPLEEIVNNDTKFKLKMQMNVSTIENAIQFII